MSDRGGLPWYRIWTEFSGHPKTLDLCLALNDQNAGMYVVRLFEHCAKHALDGRVKTAHVESICDWRKKKRGELLAALTACGVLEAEAGGVCVVHGWEERNGAVIREWVRSNAKRKTPEKPRGVSSGFSLETPRQDIDTDTDPVTERIRATPDPIRAVGGCRGGNQ